MIRPFKIDVVSRSNENIAGFAWGFSIWVALRKTGRYSVGATCTTNEPPTPRFRIRYPLKTGAEIWDAINDLYSSIDENEPALELEDWREVASILAVHDPSLAAQVWDAAEADLTEVERGAEAAAPHDRFEGASAAAVSGVNGSVRVSPNPSTTTKKPNVTTATYTPEEQALLDVMRRTEGDEFVDRHAAGILASAYRIGEL